MWRNHFFQTRIQRIFNFNNSFPLQFFYSSRALSNTSSTSTLLPPLVPGSFKSYTLDFSTITQQEQETLISTPSPLSLELDELSANLTLQGANSLWLKVPLMNGQVFTAAANTGFEFHHASGNLAFLLKWLNKTMPCKVPTYSTHVCGVGGVVIDTNGQVLVVQERSPRFSNVGWKFPGGLSESGEDFGTTAAREVFEETGIKSTFHSVISLRHTHDATSFGMSDLYVLCMMRPVNGKDGYEINIDTNEILQAKWMSGIELQKTTPHPLIKHAITVALHELENEKENELHSTKDQLVPSRNTTPRRHSSSITETELYFKISKKFAKVYTASTSPKLE
jgi:ADP-ribose pyrophosphatase YjhB (NUDIX family)